MPIPDIRLDNLRIRDVTIPEVPKWMSSDPPVALPVMPPVTMELGTPIVNIPGCVEAHKDSDRNTNLKNEDDKGTMTLCDAGTPSYYPIQYDPNRLEITTEAPPHLHTKHLTHQKHQRHQHHRFLRQKHLCLSVHPEHSS